LERSPSIDFGGFRDAKQRDRLCGWGEKWRRVRRLGQRGVSEFLSNASSTSGRSGGLGPNSLSGRDREQLFKAADQDKEKLRLTPGPRWIDNDREAQANKMVIMIDWARGRYAGLTSRNVAFSLYVETEGLEATEF
jgi:multidrug efflux pump subunit AcrB